MFCLLSVMMLSRGRNRVRIVLVLMLVCGVTNEVYAASKPHVIAFGKWNTVAWSAGPGTIEDKGLSLKVRPLLVDTRIKEFTLGLAHEVTDRLFVVRRAFRINDSLPQEAGSPPHWQWQRGGWLLVDRVTGHISAIHLPEFDVLYSDASWYRDYAAYCGVSEDGKKVYAVVAQISRRKPVLKKILEGESVVEEDGKSASPDSACPLPTWQRTPIRVTFAPATTAKQTFAIRGHIVDLTTDEDDEEAAK
jgi:hypothetical protein